MITERMEEPDMSLVTKSLAWLTLILTLLWLGGGNWSSVKRHLLDARDSKTHYYDQRDGWG